MENGNTDLLFVWFSYDEDYPILCESIESVRRCFPKAQLRVFFDRKHTEGAYPLEWVDYLENALDAEVLETEFERGGNLNGLECVHGMLESFQVPPRGGPVRWVVKVDSDTLFLDGRRFLEALSSEKKAAVFFVGAEGDNLGFCYALKPCLFQKMNALPWTSLLGLQAYFPENKTIQRLACKVPDLAPESVCALKIGKPDARSFWTGWDCMRHRGKPDCEALDVADLLGFELVDMGNSETADKEDKSDLSDPKSTARKRAVRIMHLINQRLSTSGKDGM